MKFGIFYEHQLPRPWTDGAEHRLLQKALDQVELADRLGIDYAWEVEHHFLDEEGAGTERQKQNAKLWADAAKATPDDRDRHGAKTPATS
jgi:alkanesulfonate monooxygenase SsuD/methylene tetrahydromethanopterin reductase-like flavin-dependent oxidoreductase (luciferase family)